jgi:hypothetical protein
MDLTTMWLARERTIEARQKAADDRQARAVQRPYGRRPLFQRIRGVR